MSRKRRAISLPAPYLKRVWLDAARVRDATAYPFWLPFLRGEFELEFERAVTIIVLRRGPAAGKRTGNPPVAARQPPR